MKFLLSLPILLSISSYAVTVDNPYDIETVEFLMETSQGDVKVSDFQEKTIKSSVEKSSNKTTLGDLDPRVPGVGGPSADQGMGVGEVIAIADKIIALGEKIYKLVDKGRPNSEFNYAPISIVPKTDKGAPADVLMDMSGGSMPVMEDFKIVAKNKFNKPVISFEFTLMFFHGLKYEGKGNYITAAQVIPKSVDVSWGFDFSANMKLNGIVNHGTSTDPMVGALIVLEYQIKNALSYQTQSAIFHIMGNGRISGKVGGKTVSY